jgi:protein-S-isoprenylcysteine O-methyltransferase Ste14
VLLSGVLMVMLFAFWNPVPDIVWDLTAPFAQWIVWTLFGTGWVILLLSTFMIRHFELFGLKQAWANFCGQRLQDQPFRVGWFYKLVRRLIMLGFFFAFWAIVRHLTHIYHQAFLENGGNADLHPKLIRRTHFALTDAFHIERLQFDLVLGLIREYGQCVRAGLATLKHKCS